MDSSSEPAASFPAGIVAAALALLITVTLCLSAESYAVHQAKGFLQTLSLQPQPIKWESLTFQRAAYAAGSWLPTYGSSELYCCGDPYRGSQLFRTMPTGFDIFAVGRAGTGDLMFLETFGALGGELHGKKVIISDSAPWFFGRQGINPQAYSGNFSPEIAEMFIYDAPLSPSVLEGGARLMAKYPGTLIARPLLRAGVENLAAGTPLHLAAYWVLKPLGQLDAFIKQMQDVYQSLQFMKAHPALAEDALPVRRHALNWPALVRSGTRITQRESGLTPFGFATPVVRQLQHNRAYQQALRLYCEGKTNREGHVYPYPYGWQNSMEHSAEWTALSLELQALGELHAQTLVWSIPMPGLYDDETFLSLPAREHYYQKFEQVTARPHVIALDFRSHDEDRYFLHDTGAHFTARGWIFADRAADLFWHGASQAAIQAAGRQLEQAAPKEGLPPPSPLYCFALGRR
ncbi:MAG: D-alanyl-lipoteichoic acid biosynthesis protein DltD [Chloroflexi bacterium]|nr:D-alanyl-lipoteichoic acid biosynthesis protein DltD [Chloroflexota bacterium]